MFLRFSQYFWRQKFKINISLDAKLNFMLRLLNVASQVTIHFCC